MFDMVKGAAEGTAKGLMDSELMKVASRLLEKLLGPAAEEGGLYLGETLHGFRVRNAARILKKTEACLNKAGIAARPVPPKVLQPWLDGCSLETDEELQEKWAGLLASAAAGDDVETKYVRILCEMSKLDAQLLDDKYEHRNVAVWDLHGKSSSNVMQEVRERAPPQVIRAMENLCRLGLLVTTAHPSRSARSNWASAVLSHIGEDFVEKCRGPKSVASAPTAPEDASSSSP